MQFNLHEAVARGDLAAVEAFLATAATTLRRGQLNALNFDGESPLLVAVRKGSPPMIAALIAAGADTSQRYPDGDGIIHRMAAYRRPDALLHYVSTLLATSAAAAVDSSSSLTATPPSVDCTAATAASSTKEETSTNTPISVKDVVTAVSRKDGATPLHRAAAEARAETVEALLAIDGVRSDARDFVASGAHIPLHLAVGARRDYDLCEKRRARTIKALVVHYHQQQQRDKGCCGVSQQQQTDDEETKNDDDVVVLGRAPTTTDPPPPVWHESPHIAISTMTAAHDAVSDAVTVVDGRLRTPLRVASEMGNTEAAEALLEAANSLYYRSLSTASPPMNALLPSPPSPAVVSSPSAPLANDTSCDVIGGQLLAVDAIITGRGRDVELTCLHASARGGHAAMIRFLITRLGANVHMMTVGSAGSNSSSGIGGIGGGEHRMGKTPLYVAAEYSQLAAVKAILRYGGTEYSSYSSSSSRCSSACTCTAHGHNNSTCGANDGHIDNSSNDNGPRRCGGGGHDEARRRLALLLNTVVTRDGAKKGGGGYTLDDEGNTLFHAAALKTPAYYGGGNDDGEAAASVIRYLASAALDASKGSPQITNSNENSCDDDSSSSSGSNKTPLSDLINRKNRLGLTPLHVAVSCGHFAAVKALVEVSASSTHHSLEGCDLLAVDAAHNTCLHRVANHPAFACDDNLAAIVRYLTTAAMNTNTNRYAHNNADQNLNHQQQQQQQKGEGRGGAVMDVDIRKRLTIGATIMKGPSSSSSAMGMTPLHLAATNRSDSVALVRAFAGAGADVNALTLTTTSPILHHATSVHLAAAANNGNVIRYLVGARGADVEGRSGGGEEDGNNNDDTCTSVGANRSSTTAGCKNENANNGNTDQKKKVPLFSPLHVAVHRQSLFAATVLLSLSAKCTDTADSKLIHAAVVSSKEGEEGGGRRRNLLAAVRRGEGGSDYLQSKASMESDNIKILGAVLAAAERQLTAAVVERGEVEVEEAEEIKNSPTTNCCDVNCRVRGGATPLHAAVTEYNYAAIPLLIAAGADVNAADAYGHTALHLAAFQEENNMILMAEEDENNDEEEGPRSRLDDSGSGGKTRLRSRRRVGEEDSSSSSSYASIIQLLVDAGADIERRSGADGKTPLQCAAGRRYKHTVALFRRMGAVQ